jgi:hypothetical protein
MRPVPSGVKFRFQVRFTNLSKFELGALAWVLELGKEGALHLGMGKPLGLGSVRLNPILHLESPVVRGRALFGSNHAEWNCPSPEPDSSLTELRSQFEGTMKEVLGFGDDFKNQRRIKVLKAMLQFPGYAPKPENQADISRPNTRYPSLDQREFREGVLPDPLSLVTGDFRAEPEPNPGYQGPRGGRGNDRR